MVFNTTFNNISVISWRSVLLVEGIGVPEETPDLSSVSDKLDHIMLYREQIAWAGLELTTLVVIGTDCIGSCTSNYHDHGAYYQKFIKFIDTYWIFQAVLVCCRADDFDAGKKIFQRQWKNMSFSTKNDEVSQ
jgi:hypothetical protein